MPPPPRSFADVVPRVQDERRRRLAEIKLHWKYSAEDCVPAKNRPNSAAEDWSSALIKSLWRLSQKTTNRFDWVKLELEAEAERRANCYPLRQGYTINSARHLRPEDVEQVLLRVATASPNLSTEASTLESSGIQQKKKLQEVLKVEEEEEFEDIEIDAQRVAEHTPYIYPHEEIRDMTDMTEEAADLASHPTNEIFAQDSAAATVPSTLVRKSKNMRLDAERGVAASEKIATLLGKQGKQIVNRVSNRPDLARFDARLTRFGCRSRVVWSSLANLIAV